MNPTLAITVLAALVGASLVVGLLWRSRQGAARAVSADDSLEPALVGEPTAPAAFRRRATLVQFSTEFCSGCPGTRRVLSEVSATTDGVAYLDVDVTNRADLVRRFSILQSARCR